MAPYISPEWLTLEKEMGERPLLSGSFETYQRNAKLIEEYIAAHLPARNDDQDRKTNTDITVRVYTPINVNEQLPIGIYCHEGGFCEGTLETGDPLCRSVAEDLPCIIISLDYRKAPKVPIQTVFQDALDGFIWTYEHAASLGGDQNKIFMFGCSAGGSLSLGTAHKLIELGRKGQLKAVLNLAGGTVHPDNVPEKLRSLYRAMDENAEGVPIIDRDAAQIINNVAGLNAAANDPWIFPVLSRHLADFPSTYLASCGADPLRDDNVVLESLLKKEGVTVSSDMYPGMPHLFWNFPTLESSKLFVQNLVGQIRSLLD
ncbi:uncharacterized protein A1O9_09020 [Exophiala aquamarina CBS 119918]|uniref:Alpha/beta hydrolase fold-3 domain-containing protein n=1 Tax=Exophiala aquamarina CBS 119918 TaxID=1182545 RepID=A0A072P5L6_9EURO|nr:uncharacterized protein A1O9_09020 [Exophiala aquamarina CBS 119918]KEF54578.1 hypothetical protein A1O9_09020 [Exophiala aquamarina CBS 119918]